MTEQGMTIESITVQKITKQSVTVEEVTIQSIKTQEMTIKSRAIQNTTVKSMTVQREKEIRHKARQNTPLHIHTYTQGEKGIELNDSVHPC